MSKLRRNALRFQAAYYIATGSLPLVSRGAFEKITGRKQDWWLVQMVGLLALTAGVTLAIGTRKKRTSPEILTLSTMSAASFAYIDTVHALSGRISEIYLLDAVLEIALIGTIARG